MITVDLEQIKDCDHCWHTFGSFGCCTTVSNEWVYSCKEGQKKYLLNRILEIIDKHIEAVERSDGKDSDMALGQIGIATCIRDEVLALKGGDTK